MEAEEDAVSACSDASTAASRPPDRHGFLGGAQYSPEPRPRPPADVVLRRERKWLLMLADWQAFMERRYNKVRERCRKGIPMSVRPRAWFYLCGGKLYADDFPDYYLYYCQQPGDSKCLDDIRKDLHRQFPFHEMFVSEDRPGQGELFNVLKAYSVRSPEVGFCQAQAPIAAFLLMHLPAPQAFWSLVSISDRYLRGYYGPEMLVLRRDGELLEALLKRTCAPAYRHLRLVKAEPILYMTEWFLCAFTRTLPWDSLLRIWDIFLCEGIKVLFKTALVILIGCLGASKARKQCPGLCETLQLLKTPPPHILSEEFLLYNMFRLGLSDHDFEREHRRLAAKRAKAERK